jgi:adenylate kinase family enzyme
MESPGPPGGGGQDLGFTAPAILRALPQSFHHSQAEKLDEMLEQRHKKIDAVLNFDVPDSLLVGGGILLGVHGGLGGATARQPVQRGCKSNVKL